MQKIAQVIPFQKLPRNLDFFDYLIPDNLVGVVKAGHLVEIPFKNSTILGLVVSLKTESQFKNLKPIISIKQTTPYISQPYLKLAFWFSQYYHYLTKWMHLIRKKLHHSFKSF